MSMYPSGCLKYKRSIPNDGGEQLAVGGESSHSFDDSFSEQESKPLICRCKTCRTEHLSSGKLTLNCHYCKLGFLVHASQSDNCTYICIDCGKDFESLPFTVRLCGDLQEEIQYWQADFEKRDDPERALAQWDQKYQQLGKMMNQENLKMVGLTVQLAQAFTAPTIKQDYQRAAELNHTAIKALLGYEMESISDKVALSAIMALIEQVHEDTAQAEAKERDIVSAIYVAEMQELKAKLAEH